jgi:hypothetical protein
MARQNPRATDFVNGKSRPDRKPAGKSAGKSALDYGNGQAHAPRMKTDERQFSVNHAAVNKPCQ